MSLLFVSNIVIGTYTQWSWSFCKLEWILTHLESHVNYLIHVTSFIGEVTLISTQNLANKTVTLTCRTTEESNVLFFKNEELISKCLWSSGDCYPVLSGFDFSSDLDSNIYNMTIYWVSFSTCDTYQCSDSNTSTSLTLNISGNYLSIRVHVFQIVSIFTFSCCVFKILILVWLVYLFEWYVDRNMIVYIAEVECYISNS